MERVNKVEAITKIVCKTRVYTPLLERVMQWVNEGCFISVCLFLCFLNHGAVMKNKFLCKGLQSLELACNVQQIFR